MIASTGSNRYRRSRFKAAVASDFRATLHPVPREACEPIVFHEGFEFGVGGLFAGFEHDVGFGFRVTIGMLSIAAVGGCFSCVFDAGVRGGTASVPPYRVISSALTWDDVARVASLML